MKFLQKKIDGEWLTIVPLTTQEEVDGWQASIDGSPAVAKWWRISPGHGYHWEKGDQLQRIYVEGWIGIGEIEEQDVSHALKRCHEFPGQYRIVRPVEVFRV